MTSAFRLSVAVLAVLAANLLAMAARKPVEPEPGPPPPPAWSDSAQAPRAVLLDSGRALFRNCGFCHGPNGRGGRGPTLANADFVQQNRERLIRTVLLGIHDSIRVNGVRWKNGEMAGWAETFDDFKIAAVLTYIRAALNDSLVVSCVPEDVGAGTWASCVKTPRSASEIAADSVAVSEVAATRRAIGAPAARPHR